MAQKLKTDAGKWEEVIFGWVCVLAQEVAKALLEGKLMREKGADLRVEGLREQRVTTLFGDLSIKRRLYRDSQGKHCFLLDEKMGLDKGCHLSPRVKELSTFLASHFPYHRSEEGP